MAQYVSHQAKHNSLLEAKENKKDLQRLCDTFGPDDPRRKKAEAYLLEAAEATLSKLTATPKRT